MRHSMLLALCFASAQAHTSTEDEVRDAVTHYRQNLEASDLLTFNQCPHLAKTPEQRSIFARYTAYGYENAKEFVACTSEDLASVRAYAECRLEASKMWVAKHKCEEPTTAQRNSCNHLFVLSQPCEAAMNTAIGKHLPK